MRALSGTTIASAAGLLLTGCGGSEPAGQVADGPAAPIDEAAVVAVLARADAMDGTTDKVVSKCLLCSLRMDGKPEHASTLHGYTLHLCGPSCRQAFDKDPVRLVQTARVDG